jgi:glycosyltransferase involved in cell wall biosynthesis
MSVETNEIALYQARMLELHKLVANYESNAAALQDRLHQRNADISRLIQQAAAQEARVISVEAERDTLRESVLEAHNRVVILEQTIAALEHATAPTRGEDSERARLSEIAQLQAASAGADELRTLTAELESIRAEFASATADATDARQRAEESAFWLGQAQLAADKTRQQLAHREQTILALAGHRAAEFHEPFAGVTHNRMLARILRRSLLQFGDKRWARKLIGALLRSHPEIPVLASGLFDEAFYRSQDPEAAGSASPVLHYLSSDRMTGRKPHPLFDPLHYEATNPEVRDAGIHPLLHYLVRGASGRRSPHALFDADYYHSKNRDVDGFPSGALGHYLAHGSEECRNPHPLFDTAFYLHGVPPDARVGQNPLAHYLCSGALEGRDPHPLFDTSFYLRTNPDVGADGMNPLEHYVRAGGREGRSPHPMFDGRFYLDAHPELRAGDETPLAHYLRTATETGDDPHPFFSTRYYSAGRPDVIAAGMNPLVHYVLSGEAEGELPSPLFHGWRADRSPLPIMSYLASVEPKLIPTTRSVDFSRGQRALLYRLLLQDPRSGATAAPTPGGIVFFSHDLSVSGAPLILLNLVRRFREHLDEPLYLVSLQGGDLENDFRACAATVDLAALGATVTPTEVADVLSLLNASVCVCNTVVTGDFVGPVAQHGIPVVALLHELTTSVALLGADKLSEIFSHSTRVVVPRPSMADTLLQVRSTRTAAPISVAPNGVIHTNPFKTERAFARSYVRKHFDLGPGTFVVMGCGFACPRKGFDMFVALAKQIAADDDDTAFTWIGGRDEPFATWCLHDIEKLGLSKRFRILQVADPSVYYAGSDVFVLTSREDPFPTVVLEAMDAGLPVVVFEESGGAPDAVGPDAGIVVPYLDVDAMAGAIRRLKGDAGMRRALGRTGALRAETEYSFDQYFATILDIVDDACGNALRRHLPAHR